MDPLNTAATTSRWGCLGSLSHRGKDYFLWTRLHREGFDFYQLTHSAKVAPCANSGGYVSLDYLSRVTSIVIPDWVPRS
jgi:hypothetical protein